MFNYMARLAGFRLIKSESMTVQTVKVYKTTRKWKKHGIKKKIVRKPDPNLIQIGPIITGHPETIEKLIAKITTNSPKPT